MVKTVILTGCSSGIGLAAALSFARAGDQVVATMRDIEKASNLQIAARNEGLSIDVETLDVTKSDTFERFVDDVLTRFGRIDVLVNNAGVLPIGAFEDVDETELRRAMETNFFGAANLTRVVLPTMRAQKEGYVIMVSSLSGFAAKAGDAVYSASKFALEGLTEGMRHEILRWNIKTALVEPAQYATEIFRSVTANNTGEINHRSPYRALVQSQRNDLINTLPGALNPQTLGDLLVEISRSDGARFRWTPDEVSDRVRNIVFAQSDAERDQFLRSVADIDWWIEGRNKPDTAGVA